MFGSLFILALACFSVIAEDNVAVYHPSSQALEEFSSSQGRIVSGWEAEEGQFSYMLSLRMVNQFGSVSACGASLIHHEWGLTAAHCHARRITLIVRTGVTDLKTPNLIFETSEFYNHPDFIETLPFVQPNDIALIKFPMRIEYTDYIKPIRLQSSLDKNKNYDNIVLTAAGWGRNWTDGVSPEILNWVYLKGVSNDFCKEAYGGSSNVIDATICAKSYNVTSQSICQGDSGGGLTVVDVDGVVSQIGVASFNHRSGCHTDYPAGFIRPGHYHDWIKQQTDIDFDWVPKQRAD